MIGYDNLEKSFKRLIKEDSLSHSYIFFGEPQIGKFTFATALARFIETGEFEPIEFTIEGAQLTSLSELLIVKPDEKGSIGIESVRDIKHFLSQKPINSQRRIVIIDSAGALTTGAQQALLKIAEEPPASSLLILITPNTESLLSTIRSRFQAFYFPRVKTDAIEKMLNSKGVKNASQIATLSYGRPGRAIALSSNSNKEILAKVKAVLNRGDKRAVIESVIEDPQVLEIFLSELIAELAKEPIKNYDALKSIISRNTQMSQFTTNKRLQLEEALWKI